MYFIQTTLAQHTLSITQDKLTNSQFKQLNISNSLRLLKQWANTNTGGIQIPVLTSSMIWISLGKLNSLSQLPTKQVTIMAVRAIQIKSTLLKIITMKWTQAKTTTKKEPQAKTT